MGRGPVITDLGEGMVNRNRKGTEHFGRKGERMLHAGRNENRVAREVARNDRGVRTNADDPSKGSLLSRIAPLVRAVALWCRVYSKKTPVPATPQAPTVVPRVALPPAQARLFEEKVKPLLEEFDRRNEQAVRHCIRRIDMAFETYREGVPAFVDDLMSFSTRAGVAWRKLRHGDAAVMELVNEKFAEHIFSEEEFTAEVRNALAAYSEDVQTNTCWLYSQVKLAIYESDLSVELDMPDFKSFAQAVHERAMQFSAGRAMHSVVLGVATFIVSEVATETLGAVVSRFAGATVAGAAIGGSEGSLFGPAGTFVGGLAGLVVGYAVDRWMTSRLQSELAADLDGLLTNIRNALVEGNQESATDSKGGFSGIRPALEELRRTLRASVEATLIDRLAGQPL